MMSGSGGKGRRDCRHGGIATSLAGSAGAGDQRCIVRCGDEGPKEVVCP